VKGNNRNEQSEREAERDRGTWSPKGYIGAALRPEAARHLGHPYIAKYSRVEKTPLYVEPVLLASGSRVS